MKQNVYVLSLIPKRTLVAIPVGSPDILPTNILPVKTVTAISSGMVLQHWVAWTLSLLLPHQDHPVFGQAGGGLASERVEPSRRQHSRRGRTARVADLGAGFRPPLHIKPLTLSTH
jgi:hypothetical protein